MSEENVEVVRSLLGRFNAGDYQGALDLIDPRVEWHDPEGIPGGGVHRGHEGVAQWFSRWLAAWDEFAVEPQQFIDAGDRVIVIERMRGRGRQSGVDVDQRVVASYEISNGRVSKRTHHQSEDEALEAAGLSESAMSEDNVEIVKQMIAALNARDLDRYLARCTPDVEYISPIAPIEGVSRGKEGLSALFSSIAEATTSFRIAVDEFRPLGADRVLALTRVTGTSQGGITLEQPSASLYDFAGAKVRRVEIFLDRAKALEAAGLQE